MNRHELIDNLRDYQTNFPEEQAFVFRFLELLKHPRAYYRDHLPGHMTASAWIVNQANTHVLLTHHAKLNRWLQPGGHADGDEDIVRVALKEAKEETGLDVSLPIKNIFDIDIHPIPARAEFPTHLHYDIRFAFVACDRVLLNISNESHDLKWVSLHEVSSISQNNSSMVRMVQKTLLTADQQ